MNELQISASFLQPEMLSEPMMILHEFSLLDLDIFYLIVTLFIKFLHNKNLIDMRLNLKKEMLNTHVLVSRNQKAKKSRRRKFYINYKILFMAFLMTI